MEARNALCPVLIGRDDALAVLEDALLGPAAARAASSCVDHTLDALEAAFALHDRAASIDLPLGIGISVGPAILARGAHRPPAADRAAVG